MFKSQMFSRENSDAFKLRLLYNVYISCYFKFAFGEMLPHKNPSVEMNRKKQ